MTRKTLERLHNVFLAREQSYKLLIGKREVSKAWKRARLDIQRELRKLDERT